MSGINIRSVANYANMRFDVLAHRLGDRTNISRIDTGCSPNDCTGDTVEAALVKTIDNITECIHVILDELGIDQ